MKKRGGGRVLLVKTIIVCARLSVWASNAIVSLLTESQVLVHSYCFYWGNVEHLFLTEKLIIWILTS